MGTNIVSNTNTVLNISNNHLGIKYIYKSILILLSFLLPLSLILILFSNNGFYPFVSDGQTIIMMDMQSEYIAYFRYFKAVLESNNDLVYTYSKTFGGDFLSIFTFYLSSPFNLFIVFCPYESLPAFLMLTSILKMAFAGLNMYLLLSFSSKKDKIGYLIFAIGYGLSSYSFVYMCNFMWLDGVMILPLVVLGLDCLFTKKNHWIYPLALAYSLMTSWYIGAMTCLFAVFYFIVKIIIVKSEKKTKGERLHFWNDGCKSFVFFSLLGGGLAAMYWIPAFYHLLGTKATQADGWPKDFVISLSSVLSGFLENNYNTSKQISQYTGYATMFTSSVTPVFFILFFFSKKYSKAERLSYLALFTFYFLCLYIVILNRLMHGGKDPTWFPSRYSFIVGFLVTYIGGKEYDVVEHNKRWTFAVPLVIGVIVLAICLNVENNLTSGNDELKKYELSWPSLIIFVGTVFIIYFRNLIEKKDIKYKSIYSVVIAVIMVILTSYSSYRVGDKVLDTNVSDRQYQSYQTYKTDDSYQSDFDNIKEYAGDSFYRMENTFLRPGSYNSTDNDPMFYGYNGLSHYSSSEKKEVEQYFKKLGFQYNGFFEKYDGGSTVAMNCYLGIKYLVDDTTSCSNKPVFMKNEPFEKITSLKSENTNIAYYENKSALPIGFVTPKASSYYVNEWDDKNQCWYDDFGYQNEIFKSLTDEVYDIDGDGNHVKKDIFKKIDVTSISVSDGISISKDQYGFNLYSSTDSSGQIILNFTTPADTRGKNFYASIYNSLNFNYYRYYLDGSLLEANSYWHSGIRGFNPTSTSHQLKIKVDNTIMDNTLIRDEIYYEDLSVLKEYTEAICKQGSGDLKRFSNYFSSGLEGTFSLENDPNSSSFLFTLPYEKEVSIYVDGKKIKAETKFNVFMSCDLSGLKKGIHTIKFVYNDYSFLIGSIISFSSIGVLVTYGWIGKYLIKIFRKPESFAKTSE